MPWNFAASFVEIARRAAPDKVLLRHGARVLTHKQVDVRSDALALHLRSLGLPRQSHVGHYMRNRPEYLESYIASAKAGHVHVNVNYRYTVDELTYLLETLDIAVLIYGCEFAAQVAQLRSKLSRPLHFIEIADDNDAGAPLQNDFAAAYEGIVSTPVSPPADWGFTGDDLIIIATGGTTGMPKGVMWRNADMWHVFGTSMMLLCGPMEPQKAANLKQHVDNVEAAGQPAVFAALPPLMHGAAFMLSLIIMAQGGTIITLTSPQFDAPTALREIKAGGANCMAMVGDAFAMPLCEALEAEPEAGYLAGLRMLSSTGAATSPQHKATLLKHAPGVIFVDALGSTETGSMATSIAMNVPGGSGAVGKTATRFNASPTTILLDEANRPIEPASPAIGMVAKSGFGPLGYYKDADKTAETFPTIAGTRYAITGDMARYTGEGGLEFLGRAKTCINTGGEKVFTEEVEQTLRDHPAVRDALVVGLPHPRFGQMVAAAINPAATATDVAALQADLRAHLADYKVPRVIAVTTATLRAPNGKGDYARARALAEAAAAQRSA